MNRTLIYLLFFALFLFSGCKSNSYTNKLSPSEKQERLKAWNAASPVTTTQQIIGKWSATAKDMPDGCKKIGWSREFMKEGIVVESIIFTDAATAPADYFTVKNSILYISESEYEKPDETGEIRLKSNTLYLRTKEGIYQFMRY